MRRVHPNEAKKLIKELGGWHNVKKEAFSITGEEQTKLVVIRRIINVISNNPPDRHIHYEDFIIDEFCYLDTDV